jgi:hypothetical protein
MIEHPNFRAILFVVGFLMQVTIELLRWLADMPAETATGLTSLSWLAIGGPAALAALAARKTDQRGQVRASLVVLIAAVSVFALAFAAIGSAGCLAREVRAEHEANIDWQARPTCRFEAFADGESVFTLTGPNTCDPPPDLCPVPEAEPAPTPTPPEPES